MEAQIVQELHLALPIDWDFILQPLSRVEGGWSIYRYVTASRNGESMFRDACRNSCNLETRQNTDIKLHKHSTFTTLESPQSAFNVK